MFAGIFIRHEYSVRSGDDCQIFYSKGDHGDIEFVDDVGVLALRGDGVAGKVVAHYFCKRTPGSDILPHSGKSHNLYAGFFFRDCIVEGDSGQGFIVFQ